MSDEFEELARKHEQLQRRFDLLRAYTLEVDDRLKRVENSVIFRGLRAAGNMLSGIRRRLGQALLRSPAHGFYSRFAPQPKDPYPAWITTLEAISPEPREVDYHPLVSVVMPVYRPQPEWLKEAIESVRNQTYPNWQLCIAIDGEDRLAAERIGMLAAADQRIRFLTTGSQAGISSALNAAGTLADGEYVAFVDHDDVLAPTALGYVVEALYKADVVYTDEDLLSGEGRAQPNFKPDWSPELLLSCMYMGHLLVVSRDALDRAGWFRSEFDGAQDYDLALRLDELGMSFRHVPRVLYHWRRHEQSTAESAAAKPYAHEAGRRAVAESLIRRGEPVVKVVNGPIPHTYRAVRQLPPEQGISIVVVSRNPELVAQCLESVERTRGGIPHEYVLVHHRMSGPDPQMDAVGARFGCRVVPYAGIFNFSAMNNAGVREARHDVLLFLNDDVTALEEGWNRALLSQALRPQVGVVGAKLVYPSGAIQHAGIVVGIGQGTEHAGRHTFRSDLWRWLDITRDVSAVTGACMAMRREVFEELGGFSELFPVNYNDVDLCLRAREAGYRVVMETAAVLRHDEATTRAPGRRLGERELFYERWHGWMEDPFYSPLLDHSGEQIVLAPLD
jgi:GT2 family glycosyltransferase